MLLFAQLIYHFHYLFVHPFRLPAVNRAIAGMSLYTWQWVCMCTRICNICLVLTQRSTRVPFAVYRLACRNAQKDETLQIAYHTISVSSGRYDIRYRCYVCGQHIFEFRNQRARIRCCEELNSRYLLDYMIVRSHSWSCYGFADFCRRLLHRPVSARKAEETLRRRNGKLN